MLPRLVVAGFFLLALGGCAMVTSDQALFTEADRAGAPELRQGLWAMPDADCAYDEKGPAATWPKCANFTMVTAKTLSGGERSDGGAGPQTLGYLLAKGDPPVMQLAAPPSEPKGPRFVYAGLRPTAFDDRKRVTAARIWLALCSKPPGSKDKTLKPPPATLPPGLTKRPGDPSCIAAAAEPVRKAVVRSEGWIASGGPDDFSLPAHWVREGDR
jgi:hypothetical protein